MVAWDARIFFSRRVLQGFCRYQRLLVLFKFQHIYLHSLLIMVVESLFPMYEDRITCDLFQIIVFNFKSRIEHISISLYKC